MNVSYLSFVCVCLLLVPQCVHTGNTWTDILSCVNALANSTALDNNLNITNLTATPGERQPIHSEVAMMRLFSIICSDKDGFVQCLDTSLKQSSDSMTQVIGSFFDPLMVTQAYEDLCANVTAIEQGGINALNCLAKVKMTHCQNEMADYFFYMGVVKKFAPPSEQLSFTTMETLLCSVTFQRRKCEVRAIHQCSEQLAEVMEDFYTRTQPTLCAEIQKAETANNRTTK